MSFVFSQKKKNELCLLISDFEKSFSSVAATLTFIEGIEIFEIKWESLEPNPTMKV